MSKAEHTTCAQTGLCLLQLVAFKVSLKETLNDKQALRRGARSAHLCSAEEEEFGKGQYIAQLKVAAHATVVRCP